MTPPNSPPFLQPHTVRLCLDIPHKVPTKDEQQTLERRRASAQRWKPKLQRPYPSKKEIRDAYQYKLMRHYKNSLAPVEANFIKPRIDRSPRVERLLQRYPLLSTAISKGSCEDNALEASEVLGGSEDIAKQMFQLKINQGITQSEHARRLAWKNFSLVEWDRVDRGREAMLDSGLWEEDLEKERKGLANQLPEWKKARTDRFARQHLIASSRKGYQSI